MSRCPSFFCSVARVGALVACAVACGTATEPQTRPLVASGPADLVAAAEPETTEGAFAADVAALFDRDIGGIDVTSTWTLGDYRSEMIVELRWNGDVGTLRSRTEVVGDLPDTPDGAALGRLHPELDDTDLRDDELRREIDARRSAVASMLASVDLRARGDGTWSGLLPGSNGQSQLSVRLRDGMVDEMELIVVGFDYSGREVVTAVG